MLHPKDTKIVREGGNSQMSDRPHKRLYGKSALQCPNANFSPHTSRCIKHIFPVGFHFCVVLKMNLSSVNGLTCLPKK